MWGLCLLGSGILKGEIHELLPLHHLAMLPGISPCFVSSCHSDCKYKNALSVQERFVKYYALPTLF